MRYTLRRLTDGAGNRGGESLALWLEGEEVRHEHNARPRVGVKLRVGSLYGRSFAAQDWWCTNWITQVLEDTPQRILFETASGSVYEWTVR
jgi:hypothetical protein